MNYQDYYIHLLMNTHSPTEYKKECERLKYILGAHPKPEQTEQQQKFMEYVCKNIYAGNTGKDIMKQKFNIVSDSESVEFWVNETGLSQEVLKSKVNAASRLAGIKIRKQFKLHESKLDDILK